MTFLQKKLAAFLSVMILSVIVISFVFFILNNNVVVSSECSDFVEGTLWANATIESGRVLSDTFYYPYAIPFGANLLFLPFVRLFGIGLLANRLGMLLFFSIVCLTYFYFSASIDVKEDCKYIILSLLLMAFSTQLAFNLLLHILYYLLDFLCMIGMLASIIWLKRSVHKRKHYFMLTLFSIWGAANGPVSITLSLFPVLAALILTKENPRTSRMFWTVAGCTVCGLLLYKLVMADVMQSQYIEFVGSYTLLRVSDWFENIRLLPRTWFDLFIAFDPQGISIFRGRGVFVILEIFFSLIVTASPIPYIVRYRRLSFAEKAVFHSACVVWMICLTQFIFLRGYQKRLLYNCVLVNAMLLAVWYPHLHMDWGKWQTFAQFAVGGLAMLYLCLFLVSRSSGPTDYPLADELMSRGFSHGYATYWNSNKLTVLSGGKIKSATVFIPKSTLLRYRYNMDATWYQHQPGDFYVALDEDAINKLRQNEAFWNNYFQEAAKDVFVVDDITVFVFDEPYWDLLVEG